MSIKGFPTQEKLTQSLPGYTDKQSFNTSEFATVQPTASHRNAMDIVSNGVYRIAAIKTAEVGSTDLKRILISTAHGAKKGDVVRFQTTSANPGFESAVLSVPDANTILLAAQLDADIDEGTDQFYILRHVTAAFDSNGNVQVSQGPVQYLLNGAAVEVEADTAVPANSKPLPVRILNPDGTEVEPATQNTLQSAADSLATLEAVDFATEATLTTISNIDFATEAKQDILIAEVGATNEAAPGTDTAISGLNGRLQRVAQNITSLIARFPLTLGQKTKATAFAVTLASDEDLLTNIGIVTETAPVTDTASSGLNGRLQRVAQRITSLIALLPAALGQGTMSQGLKVVFGADQTPFADLTNSGTITTQNLVPAGAATAGSAVASGSLNGQNCIGIQVVGTYTGALSLQSTLDGTNWKTIAGLVFTDIATGTQSATITSASQSIYQADCAGFAQVRVTGLAAMTGTATITLRSSSAAGLIGFDMPLPLGSNVIGALTANQSVNVAQMNGVATSMGVGPSGTGVLRVTHSNTATATLANVASSATNVTLQASNANRRGLTCLNDSTSLLYLKFGATASTTSHTVQVPAGGYFEMPQPVYSGIVDGIWASANGFARMTEW